MAEGGQGEVIGVFFFFEVNALHAEVRFRLAKFFVGGVASERQPPSQFDLRCGVAGLPRQALGQGFALAVGEMVIQQGKSLRRNNCDIALPAGDRRVAKVKRRHEWQQTRALGHYVNAAPRLLAGRRVFPVAGFA